MKGTYILILRLPKKYKIQIGKLGIFQFETGFYTYVGSALNGLEARIQRHMRNKPYKKLFWHIDYLRDRAEISKIFIKNSNI